MTSRIGTGKSNPRHASYPDWVRVFNRFIVYIERGGRVTCFRKGISDSRGRYLLECFCLSSLPVFVRLTPSFCNNIEFRTNDS